MNSKTLKAFAGVALLLIVSVGVAMWSETLRVNVAVATGEVDWEIVPGPTTWLDACGLLPGYGNYRGNDWNASYLPKPGAKQLDKDVGCTDVTLIDSDGDGDYDTMNVTLYNVYPWYYTHIAFKVHNDGSVPIKIWRVVIDGQEFHKLNEQELKEGLYLDLTGDEKFDILIWWGDNFGVQLHPCESADVSFDITVLQGAPQGSTLTFTISLEAIQWNEYSTPTTTIT
ncbi:MAG: hypothetical protein B7O98_04010 [Zestosphaera tikiterensis]|uniref:Uncharacterized protein n=1 Tax=Zestosphaera tikiterensis TaxID=1973259 RepID=A0A2R7Y7T0_9CREN|nr:MAG: hypothetical protein B7O98_04010 [Zestosphaera tikiterensis]